MKKVLLSLAVLTTLFSSCKRNDDDFGDDYITNTWSVDGMRYDVVNCSRVGGNFSIHVNDGKPVNEAHSLTFIFAGNPTTGRYKIVDYPAAPDEVSVLAQNGSLASIYRGVNNTGEGSAREVNITVNDNKATVRITSPVILQPLLPAGGPGVEVTASVREL